MKRICGNGGSRSALRDEGIIIMGDYDAHRHTGTSPVSSAFPSPGMESSSARGLCRLCLGLASLSRRWTADCGLWPLRKTLCTAHRRFLHIRTRQQAVIMWTGPAGDDVGLVARRSASRRCPS